MVHMIFWGQLKFTMIKYIDYVYYMCLINVVTKILFYALIWWRCRLWKSDYYKSLHLQLASSIMTSSFLTFLRRFQCDVTTMPADVTKKILFFLQIFNKGVLSVKKQIPPPNLVLYNSYTLNIKISIIL